MKSYRAPSRATLALAAITLIAGCAAPRTTVQTVRQAVPVPCTEPQPARPAMPTEALRSGATLDVFVAAAAAEIERREGYEGELRAALDACRAPLRQGD